MSAKRGATGLAGVLLVDKPAGCTSHDVVGRVRRATGERRVGHAGTLDPSATGLLVILVGPYTRLEPYLSSQIKRYEACVSFGFETDTDDAEGTATRSADVPEELRSEPFARSVLASFLGDSLQTPPAYSAIKSGGQVAHRVARGGGILEIEDRPITVHAASLLAVETADGVTWRIDFTVSKGTYIRALARDIGRCSHSAAHLTGLRRTASGVASIVEAHDLESVETHAREGRLEEIFVDPVRLMGLQVVDAPLATVSAGRPLPAPEVHGDRFAVITEARLRAVYRREGDALVAEAVFPLQTSEDR